MAQKTFNSANNLNNFFPKSERSLCDMFNNMACVQDLDLSDINDEEDSISDDDMSRKPDRHQYEN